MPTNGNVLTLLDWADTVDPNGQIPTIVEMLNQTNDVLLDMTWVEGNMPTGHKSIIRTGLPASTWRKLNYGVPPTKATNAPVVDNCGMLEQYGKVDKDLAKLNGNLEAFLLSQNSAHIEGMTQDMVSTLFYGDTDVYPERFMGFAPRFATKSTVDTNIGYNIIDGKGTGDDNTSVWLVVWGENTCFGIFPKGSKVGLDYQNLGEQTVNDPDGNPYQAYLAHYQWKPGLVVADWRYVVRIANVDVSNLDTTDAADLIKLMAQAYDMVPNINGGKPAFYCNNKVKSALRTQLMNKGNAFITMDDIMGPRNIAKKDLTFLGVPVRKVDKIINTESKVV